MKHVMKKITVFICLLLAAHQTSSAREITVKYRDTPVDVSHGFIEYDLIESSLLMSCFMILSICMF